MELFKIRRKSDNKFSSGGSNPCFNKLGKMWRKQYLNSHLLMVKSTRDNKNNGIERFYSNCEIVTYKIKEIGTEDMSEYTDSNPKLRRS